MLRMQFEAHYNGILTNKISEKMENEKNILEMAVMEIETWIKSCIRKLDKYKNDMNEDYTHFFCWHSEDMYKVQLKLKEYRELEKAASGGRLDDVKEYLRHTAERYCDDLIYGSVQNHSTDTSFNTAHLLEREVKQDILCEYKTLLGYIAKQEAKSAD